VQSALYASKIVSYAQGYMLLREASNEYKWKLNFGSIALMWRGGCIIRSRFLGDIKRAFDKNPALENLLVDDFFINAIKSAADGWRTPMNASTSPAASSSIRTGPVAAATSALAVTTREECVDVSCVVHDRVRHLARCARKRHDMPE
jgi:6-phosphogluconate dehydrogenase